MKKNHLIFLALVLVLVIIFLVIRSGGEDKKGETGDSPDSGSQSVSQNDNNEKEEGEEESDGRLEMQGYYLNIPSDYTCEGGFVGYRYLDAECFPVDERDYKIVSDFGLPVTRVIGPSGFLENQLPIRSLEFTGGVRDLIVCEAYTSENLNLEAEHYLCDYNQDGKDIITLGIGRVFSANDTYFARWFESHLIIEEKDSQYDKEDYVDSLVKFLDSAIDIDWEYFNPENL